MAGAILGLAAIALPLSADAQVLRYQNRYSKADVGRIIAKLESTSNTFRRGFDRAMDRSPLNGTNEEDRYNDMVSRFENALDRLRGRFDGTDSWWETRNDVSDVIRESRDVNTMMNTISFRRNLERQWNNMRNDINKLADTFDLPGLNGGGWNGGGGGGGWGGGRTSTPPTWTQGTFYGTAPDGTQITLTINASGQVTAVIGGNSTYGTYYRGSITMNGATSRVDQAGNGIRTTRGDNGEVITYSRNAWGGGGNWGGGRTSTPPTWTQGTFYGTAPDGTQITLTINASGQVTAVIGGNSTYGTYYRGSITMNGATSRVDQAGNGIRTTRGDNGEVITYSRNAWGGSGGNWGGGSTPVSWSVGSFSAVNPQTGGMIYLTVNSNGQVTVNIDGSMTYGTLYGTILTINGITSTVQKDGSGIRTVRNDNGERITYRRN